MARSIRMRQRRNRKGFSLLEILLVLVILSVVAGIVGLALFPLADQGKAGAVKQQFSIFKDALKMYRLNCGSYPATLQALHERPADANNWVQTLESEIQNDPWGQPYQYKVNGQSVELRSAGPDMQMNTEDDVVG